MQIDFHHAVTYVVARLAGFTAPRAAIIAHAAQYVDDATNSGEIAFSNGAGYTRISSAHKTLDYRNFHALANANVWVPFHFLPGNGDCGPNESPQGGFVRKLVCRPDSVVAQEMVRRCIAAHDAPHALHRLGITMHVYADTWAHQGFAGINHEINLVRQLKDSDGRPDDGFVARLKVYFGDQFEALQSLVVDNLPLGHGAALSHPDLPFLRWGYTNGLGEKVERDNLVDFVTAASRMFAKMVEYRIAAGEPEVPREFPAADLATLRANLAGFQDRSGEARHANWCDSIAAGDFGFGPERLEYIAKGEGSWKHWALGTLAAFESDDEEYEYQPAFLRSDWKLFHDALQVHRLVVLHEILPRFGICVA